MGMKLWSRNNKKGQAILELAIFGSILIFLLGILVNYGLKYNFQQQAMQQAFRRALGVIAADAETDHVGSASYILVKDRHIPDPTDSFAVGSVIPVTYQANIVRDYAMHRTADTPDKLPHRYFDINDQTYPVKTAGLRKEYNVPEYKLGEDGPYNEIYGARGTGWWTTGSSPTSTMYQGPALYNVTILDQCAGELIDYDSCLEQCQKIEENNQKQGRRINEPWYCSRLDELFPGKRPMGLQRGYIQETRMNNKLERTETPSGINATDTLNWQADTQRTIVYNDGLDGDGVSRGVVNIKELEVTTSVSQKDKTYEWQTN